jgi:pimeloyl-ACP methyl ester carboxylesterase
MQQPASVPGDFIVPLNMNGLDGRMLHMPAPKNRKREILFVYGHHASLERWWGLMQVLNRYGAVTMPDLPGFGGMDSFYTIGQKPNIDALADYMAAFIKLRYKRKKVTIAAMSFGFVVVTRMLQRYPELTKKVELLVSIVGFAHRDDFTFSRSRYWMYRLGATTMSTRPMAFLFRHVALHPWVLRAVYGRTHNAKHKFKHVAPEDLQKIMDFEIELWHCNDVRTYMFTSMQFLTLDNCTAQIPLPLYHVSARADHFFDNHVVEQHLRIIFQDVECIEIKLDSHAPSIIADAKAAAPLVPPRLRRVLSK